MTGIIGVFQSQSGLKAPFLVLFVQVYISGIDVFMVKEMIGLGGIHHGNFLNKVKIIGRIISGHITGLDSGFQFQVIFEGVRIIRFKGINGDIAGQVAG